GSAGTRGRRRRRCRARRAGWPRVDRSASRGFFFFSSRRRHTRFSRDWSSDVCSSDLGTLLERRGQSRRVPVVARTTCGGAGEDRSEERRVGKECRSGGAGGQEEETRRTPPECGGGGDVCGSRVRDQGARAYRGHVERR